MPAIVERLSGSIPAAIDDRPTLEGDFSAAICEIPPLVSDETSLGLDSPTVSLFDGTLAKVDRSTCVAENTNSEIHL